MNTASTPVTALTEGVYSFKLKVTDAGGLNSDDTIKITVLPVPIQHEIIYNDLIWNLWIDPTAPGNFDEISFHIYDSTIILPNSSFSVFVKTVSSNTWVTASAIPTSPCNSPYYYYNLSPPPGRLYLLINQCISDYNQVGTSASVKVVY